MAMELYLYALEHRQTDKANSKRHFSPTLKELKRYYYKFKIDKKQNLLLFRCINETLSKKKKPSEKKIFYNQSQKEGKNEQNLFVIADIKGKKIRKLKSSNLSTFFNKQK